MVRTLASSTPPVLFRRRSARRQPSGGRRQSRETLPDWAWGVAIGVFVLLVIGTFWLGMNIAGGGSGGGTCSKALPPLGNSDVSEQAFQDEDDALGRVLALLNNGDVSGAESAFFGPVHNFTHNVDPPVRELNEELARDLCEAVIALEDSLAFEAGAVKIAFDLQKVRDLLRDAAQVLGYRRPG